MVTLEEVDGLARALPEVTVGERFHNRTWLVAGKSFAWERPYSKADLRRFGDRTPPSGPILGVRTADLEEKEILLGSGQAGVFTIEHFNGYPAVLVQLDVVAPDTLRDLLTDAWLAVAPEALATAYLHSA
jgi:hypothetical protein